jgi:hypothetical protein
MEGRWGQTYWDCLKDGERRNRVRMGNRKERERIFLKLRTKKRA